MPLPRSLARFNRSITNHVTRPMAEWLPGFGIVTHRGRRSGRTYRTPVNVFRRPGGHVFALTYGRGDWVENVMAAGKAELLSRRRIHRLSNARIVHDKTGDGLPLAVRGVLRLLRVDEFLIVDDVA